MSFAPSPPARSNRARASNFNRPGRPGERSSASKSEPRILFQKFFKSVGPRTYAAQVKEAGNGNHFIVLTEGKRDDKSEDVKKTRLFLFSEDFDAFRDLLRDTFAFVRDHPLPEKVRAKRARFWAKKNDQSTDGEASRGAAGRETQKKV